MIPGASIFFMFVSVAISVGLPIVLFMVWRKKYSLKIVPVIVGIVMFMFFKGLEQIMHLFVLQPWEPYNSGALISLWANPALYIIYVTLAAGIFEETGRFLAFQLLKSRYKGAGTGLAYGIGHGGVEAIMFAGLAMISTIVISVMINNENIGFFGSEQAALKEIEELAAIRPVIFLSSGIERILAISVHISLSVIVWCSVTVKGNLWMYPAAIITHAIVNIAPAMYQAQLITSIWLVEAILILPAALIAFAAYHVCKILKKANEIEVIEAVQEN